jgi:RNA polymerase sigma factor (sigma-70 family)
MNDAELLRRYVDERSQEAFTTLVTGRFDLVYSAALRQVGGDSHRAQDVAQTVFADLARKAPALRGHPSLIGWFYTSTHFAAAKVVRTEQRRRVREAEAQTMHDLNSAPSADAVWLQIRPALDRAILTLAEQDRQALLLRFFDGRSLAEVGRELGVGEDAAQKRVERALERLRGLLARHGLTSTTAVLGAALANQAVAAAPAGLAAAVAGGALAAAPAFGFISLMATSKFVGGIAVVLAVALGTVSYEVCATRQLRAAVAAAELENAGLRTRLDLLEQSAAGAATAQAPQGPALASASSAAPSPTPGDDAIERGKRLLADHPEIRDLLRQRAKADFDAQYGALVKTLGLNAAQIEAFGRIVSAAQRPMILGNSTGNFAFPDSDLTLSEDEKTAQLQALLGPQGFEQFREATRQAPLRTLVTQLAASSYYTPSPVTADQAAQLQSLLAALSADYQDGGTANASSVNWDQALAQAQAFLSPSQLAILARLQQQAVANQALAQTGAFGSANGPVNVQMQFGAGAGVEIH